MRRSTTSTMSTSFYSHGLVGIEIHHAHQRREQQVAQARMANPVVSGLRQRLGAAIIGAGEHLVGRQASAETLPHVGQTGLAS